MGPDLKMFFKTTFKHFVFYLKMLFEQDSKSSLKQYLIIFILTLKQHLTIFILTLKQHLIIFILTLKQHLIIFTVILLDDTNRNDSCGVFHKRQVQGAARSRVHKQINK